MSTLMVASTTILVVLAVLIGIVVVALTVISLCARTEDVKLNKQQRDKDERRRMQGW